MMIRFRRKITRRQLLHELAAEHGSIQRLKKRTARKPNLRPVLEEWLFNLRQSDQDEPISLEHTVVFHDPAEFLRVWTPQRLLLYEYLKRNADVESIRDLATRLGRNYRNVYDDAQRLAKARILSLERHANHIVPRAVADEVTVTV